MSSLKKNEMIQVRPEVKLKGFMPENLSKIISSREFTETQSRINRLVSSDSFIKLSEKDKNYILLKGAVPGAKNGIIYITK